jgi:hypothetical protein
MIEEFRPSQWLFAGKTGIRNFELFQISILVKHISGSSVPPRSDIHAMRRTANG